jgi:CheY-like chemotaxis protein
MVPTFAQDVRTYSSESLRELGYNVLEAQNARTALQMLESHAEVAVIFTDIGLPGGTAGSLGRKRASFAQRSRFCSHFRLCAECDRA